MRIDAYLAAAAAANQGLPVAARMVMCLGDVPQEGTLPDLGNLIRTLMMQRDFNHKELKYVYRMLQAALPCLLVHSKANSKSRKSCDQGDGKQVGICLLLALLLGLYPSCVKFPPFQVRVNVFRRVHLLFTSGKGSDFCRKHTNLMTLAFMEYCCHILGSYMPVELAILQGEQGMQGFFHACPVLCDTFRQEVLLTGLEEWGSMDEYCASIVEKHSRVCKNRRSQLGRLSERVNFVEVTAASQTADIHYIVPYSIHLQDASNTIMVNEMAFINGNVDRAVLQRAAGIQRLIKVHPLPSDIVHLQLKVMGKCMAVCERSAVSSAILYVCMQCLADNNKRDYTKMTRGQCRLDLARNVLVCAKCLSDCIVQINSLGKIVCLKEHRFYFAPCCNKVQMYEAKGGEFQCVFDQASMDFVVPCCHCDQLTQKRRSEKRRCEVCNSVALPHAHTAVDHLTAEVKSVFLCQRHTPTEDALKQVANFRQLQNEIRKRDRPLFRHEK